MNLIHFTERFAQWFQSHNFESLARQTGWLKRRGKIDPFQFILSLAFAQMSALRLTLNAQAQSFTEPVTRQAVDQRYTPQAVTFVQAAFEHTLSHTLDWRPKDPMAHALQEHFAAVYQIDSTSFDCPESLKTLFPGCGGGASDANLKVLLRYEYCQSRFEPLALLPGKRSDQGLAGMVAEKLRPGELQITDKGFFKIQVLEEIDRRGAYYLMPLAFSATLWELNSQGQEQELELARTLDSSDQNHVEFPSVFLGRHKGNREKPVRVVAFRLSEQSTQRKRAALREAYRKRGGVPTQQALMLAGWLVLITNSPADKLPSHAMAYLYRTRWQIELIFKQCKSVLRLNVTESENPYRVQCEVWARLLCALALFLWHSHSNAACWKQYQREISFAKLATYFQQQGHSLTRALIQRGTILTDTLSRLWRHVLKGARKEHQRSRKTTWQNLQDHWLSPTVA